jgi:hypothetical protein
LIEKVSRSELDNNFRKYLLANIAGINKRTAKET